MKNSYSCKTLVHLEHCNSISETSTSSTMIRDWRQQLKTPPTYRIGNRTFRLHYHLALLLICIVTVILIFFYMNRPESPNSLHPHRIKSDWFLKASSKIDASGTGYNYTYPLSVPIISNGIQSYRIGLIADMDKDSRDPNKPNTWRSYFKQGYLSYNSLKNTVVASFNSNDKTIEISGNFALNGRGMELSELVTFNGRILTFDDRTGLVYELIDDKILPWILLMDGAGKSAKGFKSEWAAVKDEVLFVGSMGKEWTTSSGEFESFDPMYVKAVTMSGEVHHLNWVERYKAIRSAIGIEWPGYMIHESAAWSAIHRKWYFLPRRCSKERYNETLDELRGCNVLITADENFRNIETVNVGAYKPTQGFSSFKFVPGSSDSIIVALQTEEINGKTATYVTAFKSDGTVLMESTKLNTDLKYEGIEFT